MNQFGWNQHSIGAGLIECYGESCICDLLHDECTYAGDFSRVLPSEMLNDAFIFDSLALQISLFLIVASGLVQGIVEFHRDEFICERACSGEPRCMDAKANYPEN